MHIEASPPLTRAEIVMIWALEAIVENLDPAMRKAVAWDLNAKKLIAETKVLRGTATEPEIGAIALAQTFLDEVGPTLAG